MTNARADCSPLHPPLPRRRHLAALTGLRFFAALHVVFYHEAKALIPAGPLQQVVASGYVGVALFFVLSGFILAYTYLPAWDSPPIDKRRFLTARFARVYPVYALSLVVALPTLAPWAAANLTRGGLDAAKVLVTGVANVALLQAWIPQTVAPWNTPGWSLSAEAFFYLIFPAAAVWMSRRRSATLGWLIAGIWVAALVPGALYLTRHPELLAGGEPARAETGLLFLKYFPLARVPEFLIGLAIGVVFLRVQQRWTETRRWPALLSVAATIAIIALLAAPRHPPYPLVHDALLAPLFALLVLSLAAGRGPVAAFLAQRPIVLLGQASYATYLLHEPLAGILYKWPWSPMRGLHGFTRFWVYLAIVIAVSILVLWYFEEPARRAIRDWEERRTPADVAPRAVTAIPSAKAGGSRSG